MMNSIEEIFKNHYGSLCYFASRYVQDENVVEDLVQDVFVSLLEKSPRFDSEAHLKNFLYLSIRNACLNYIRDRQAQSRYMEAKGRENLSECFEDDIILTEVYRELTAAVVHLPEECRKVFDLCYFQGMDNTQAAEVLGVSVNTVKTQKARGKKILRENLKDLYPLLLLFLDLLDA